MTNQKLYSRLTIVFCLEYDYSRSIGGLSVDESFPLVVGLIAGKAETTKHHTKSFIEVSFK